MDESADPLRSVSIALSIFECLQHAPEVGPTAVARELGIAKSTASRMLAVMATRGVLERLDGGRYRLGLRMFEYGQLTLDRLPLFAVGVPILAELRDRVRDLVQLGVPVGAEILFLDRFEAQNLDARFHGSKWRRVPAHSSSSGRAIAAFNPAVAAAIFEAGLTRRTRYTVVDPNRLREILARARERGYVSTDEELEEGISSIAAPVRVRVRAGNGDGHGHGDGPGHGDGHGHGDGPGHGDGDGHSDGLRAIAAVSVVGPSRRLHRDGIATVAARACEAARRIGEALAPE